MRRIQILVEQIEDELCGAKDYAQCYVEAKAFGNTAWANRYKEMSNDELKHAMYLHDIATTQIEDISKVFTAPVDMQERWEDSHKEYVEKTAWIKQMLQM